MVWPQNIQLMRMQCLVLQHSRQHPVAGTPLWQCQQPDVCLKYNSEDHEHAFRYCASQLENLIAMSVGNTSESYLKSLQAELEKCDRLGSSNRDLPADEDVSTFSVIIGSAENAAEVAEMVEQLLTS